MNCKVCNNTSIKNQKVSFFRFPSENDRCKDWVERCNLKEMYQKYGTNKFHKSFRICSDHFDVKNIVFDGRKKKLLACAVPEIFRKKRTAVQIDNDGDSKDEASSSYDSTFKLKMVQNLCRLCAEDNRNLTDIFGFRGKSLELENKLKYLPITICEHDVLPLRVCQKCIVKTNELHHFITNCVKADTKLKIMLDLEGCDTTYGVTSKEDTTNVESGKATEESNKVEANGNFFSDLNEPDIIAEQNETVYIWPTTDTNSYQVLLQEVENPDMLSQGIPVNIESQQTSQSADNFSNKPQTVSIVIKKLNLSNLVKEVDFSGHLGLEHDYSNLLKQDAANNQEMLPQVQIPSKETDASNKITKSVRFSCDTCLKTFSTLELLNFHARAHQLEPDELGRFVCKSCDRIFSNRYHLNEHMRLHTGECPYKCHICEKRFHKIGLLKQHLLVHNPEKPFFCSICNVRSSRRGNLIQHMKSHFKTTKAQNSKAKPIKTCRICFHMFATLEDLRTHERSEHFEEGINSSKNNLNCGMCLESFQTTDECDQHWDSHIYLSFICGICKKNFISLDSLKHHFKCHTSEAKYACQYCDKAFKSREICSTHERSHTGEAPYGCGECGKTFRSRAAFHQHRVVHSNKRIHSCAECGMSFKRKDTLNNHSRIHTGERPFACQICGFAFKQRGDCKKHERNHKKRESDSEVNEEEMNEPLSPKMEEMQQQLLNVDTTQSEEQRAWVAANTYIT